MTRMKNRKINSGKRSKVKMRTDKKTEKKRGKEKKYEKPHKKGRKKRNMRIQNEEHQEQERLSHAWQRYQHAISVSSARSRADLPNPKPSQAEPKPSQVKPAIRQTCLA